MQKWSWLNLLAKMFLSWTAILLTIQVQAELFGLVFYFTPSVYEVLSKGQNPQCEDFIFYMVFGYYNLLLLTQYFVIQTGKNIRVPGFLLNNTCPNYWQFTKHCYVALIWSFV